MNWKVALCLFIAVFQIAQGQSCRARPDAIRGLEPSLVWTNFYRISCIPRCPEKEKGVRDLLLKPYAQNNKFEYIEDKKGNVLIKVPAKPGKEDKPTIVLQTHLDMVCEKNSGIVHDFDKDPIELHINSDKTWINANGTTLGADDGIGVASVLALVLDPKAVHGPLELLFTVEEEIGLRGAAELQPGFLKGKVLINIDSDTEGETTIGCAGGSNVREKVPLTWIPTPSNHFTYQLKVHGGQGGHSGVDINKNRANMIKITARILDYLSERGIPLQIAKLEAGTATNAIPREAFSLFAVPNSYGIQVLVNHITAIFKDIKSEFKASDPRIDFDFTISTPASRVVSEPKKIIQFLNAHQTGVYRMSPEIPGLVETSLNLANIRTEEKEFLILSSIRSSVESQMKHVVSVLKDLTNLAGGSIEVYGNYPGWEPNLNSQLLQVNKRVYKEIFGTDIKVLAIHAGLETGIIGSKFPGMDMISIGATSVAFHSPGEKLYVPSVPRIYRLVLGLLADYAK